MTFQSWLDNTLSTGDDEIWATHGETVVTRARLRAEVAMTARTYAAHGITAGSTVAVQLMPSFTMLWSLFALWSSGVRVMLLDPRLTVTETDRLLDLCEPDFHLATDTSHVFTPFRDECAVVVRPRRVDAPAPHDRLLIQFSSGSTGLPKAIGRTGASLLSEIDRFAQLAGMPVRGDNVLLLSSLAHSFGLVGGVLHALNTGAALHFVGRPHRRGMLGVLHGRRISAVFGVPAHVDMLSRIADAGPPPTLRLAVSGGEVLPAEVYDQFLDRYGVRVGQAYGMTESGIIATDLAGRDRPPAVGTPAPGIETKIAGGTLHVRLDASPYLYADVDGRYVNGWLDTHDRCNRRDSGVLEIVGRTDSLVAIGGLKVDLMEVEAVLAEHTAITEVVVVYGETIEAHVVAEPVVPKGELLAWCRERLSPHKIPKAFHYRAALPRTSNGKLVRNREMLHLTGTRRQAVAG